MSNRKSYQITATICFVLLTLGTAACDQGAAGSGGPGDIPEATFSARALPDGSLEIQAQIPPRHHAYLDAGDHGNLIPIAFDWQGLEPAPEKVSTPAGVRDDAVGAQVLRDGGRFVFKAGADAEDLNGKTVKVRSQICDEDKGICYRPTWTDVRI